MMTHNNKTTAEVTEPLKNSGRTVALTTLGCKVNQYESDAISEQFGRLGYQLVDFAARADVYVINTCTVTHLGDRKSRQMIRRAIQTNPQAVIAATGCYVQVAPEAVAAIPGVDLIIGNDEKSSLAQQADRLLTERLAGNKAAELLVGDIMQVHSYNEMTVTGHAGKTRAFLKIQEGCNNFCSYCIVPYARGPLRSRQVANVLQEARLLIERGYQEIVLTGIHVGAYGADLQNTDLFDLLQQLVGLPGLHRLRLSSIDPHEVTADIIELMRQSPIFCPHFHIPLQSGNNKIIKLMNRHYTCEQYAALVQQIRAEIPQAAITTDVIVGFPGESEDDFQSGYDFIAAQAFSRLHVFKYSPRQGTPAAALPQQVTAEAKEERSRRLLELNTVLQQNFAARFIGQVLEVLPEQACSEKAGWYEGLTGNYLKVEFTAADSVVTIGRPLQVLVQELGPEGLYGTKNL